MIEQDAVGWFLVRIKGYNYSIAYLSSHDSENGHHEVDLFLNHKEELEQGTI